jgi:phosphoribosylanthranilate isomerase
MKIKVCGMRNQSNIGELVKLKPDYVGFIFYTKSKRYIGAKIPPEVHLLIPDHIQKVGVFVDEPFDSLIELYRENRLGMVQLHGNEHPDYCERLKKLDISVIKVFSITKEFDFETIKPYDCHCDYYLFDTGHELRGGSGTKFNWDMLGQYTGNKPFFLSGGIQPADVDEIRRLSHDRLYAIDVNSGFEIEAGIKNIPELKSFFDIIHNY